MGLDRFMGIDSKENKPKKKKKKSSKSTPPLEDALPKEKNKSIETTEYSKESSKPIDNPKLEPIKEDLQAEPLPSFTFVSITFKCTKCKYKKNMKRPQSFTPREKDLICPKCGAPLKKSRSK
jgi:hypothetical protein